MKTNKQSDQAFELFIFEFGTSKKFKEILYRLNSMVKGGHTLKYTYWF